MSFLWTLLIGGIIGWIAGGIMKTGGQMGIIANIVVGIVGAFVGHFLAPMIGVGAENQIGNLAISLGGAVVLIIALRALGIFK